MKKTIIRVTKGIFAEYLGNNNIEKEKFIDEKTKNNE